MLIQFHNIKQKFKSNFFNKYVFSLVAYDWKKMYKGSLMGIFWTFIKPLFSIVLFLFGNIVINNSTLGSGTSSIFSLILGMLPWMFISESMSSPTFTFSTYGFLITKMKYSKHKILIFTNFSRFIQHFILMTLFFVAYFITYFIETYSTWNLSNPLEPRLYMLQLPLVAIMMFIFFYGWSILISILSIISNDSRQVIAILITGIFWISGTFYNPSNIDSAGDFGSLKIFIQELTFINPLATFISMFRNSFCVNFSEGVVNNFFFFEGYNNWYPFLWVWIWIIIIFLSGYFVSWKTREWFNDQL